MDIEQIDPHNGPALAAWHATVVAADSAGREDVATPWQLPEVQAQLASQTDVLRLVYAGIEDGRTVVAAGQVALPLTHSTTHAEVQVFVHPDHRRQGHGSRMMGHLVTVARGHGRAVLNSETVWPYEGPADGAGTPGVEFLRRHGFVLGLGNVMRTLDLPIDHTLLDRLAAEAAPHHGEYELRSFVGRVPVELEQGWADLVSGLSVEAPTGGMERERESADVEELRRRQDLAEAQGRTKYHTAALSPEGHVVAYTDLATTRHDPDNAFQWGTLVDPAHRGHRLGLAVKVANLRLLQAEQRTARRVRTWNAEVNGPMIAVNEWLGFRPVERLGEFQRRL